MRSAPIAAAAVLLSLALILPGCGDEGTATAGGEKTAAESTAGGEKAIPNGATGARGARVARPAAAKRCGRLLGGLLDSMESLNNTVAVGLDYDSYLGAVNNVRATYASVPAERLPLVCLTRVAGPAERALNAYIEAANAWGECLAGSSCDPESVEPKLQRKWEEASDLLSVAGKDLRNLG